MTFRQAAILLVASGLVGCKPTTPDAGTPAASGTSAPAGVAPAAEPTADMIQAQLTSLVTSGCRTRRRVAGAGDTRVQICAVEGANEISSDTAPPWGFVVGTIVRTGNARDDRWRLDRGKTYYLRVFQTRSGHPDDGYYEITSWSGTSWEAPKASGSFVHCGVDQDHPRQPRSHAGFSTCDQGQPADAEDPTPLAQDTPSGGPAWITCAEGCCTTDAI